MKSFTRDLRDVAANELDCGFVVSQFELLSRSYVRQIFLGIIWIYSAMG